MKKYGPKINCHNFTIGCNLGQAGELVRKEKGESPSNKECDICFTFFPKYKMERFWLPDEGRPIRNNQPIGTYTMENEQIAEKLNNPEEYAKTWGKKDKNQELIQLKKKLAQADQWLSNN